VATERYDGVEGIYGGAWTGPVFVLTHRPPAEDPAVTFLSTGIAEAVATARAAAEDKNLEIFGANTAQQCLREGLVDEIVVHLAPILLGDGVRLDGAAGAAQVELERVSLAEAGQLTDLRFRVRSGAR
jgi:dihydrofolate reductase